MAHDSSVIHVTDDSDLVQILEAADSGPVTLERGGVTYRLSRDGPPGSDTAAKIRKAVDATAGSWSDLDADAVINYIYRGREEGSRPADCP
jgi:hypothetical protein